MDLDPILDQSSVGGPAAALEPKLIEPKSLEPSLPPSLAEGLKSSHLPSLDGLRAVAAFLVVFYHAALPLPGGLGVLIFFVLSGFLITWLLLKEADEFGTISLKRFYLRRALRIFPAFYVYALGLLSLLLIFGKRVVWPQVLSSLFYVNNYYQALWGDPKTGFSHTWSLGIEEQFYLLWPSLFLLLNRDRQRMMRYLAIGIVVVWAYRCLLVMTTGLNQIYFYESFETRADSLMMGCLLAVVLREGKLASFFSSCCSRPIYAVFIIAFLALSSYFQTHWGHWYRDLFGLTLNSLLTAILIAQMIAFRSHPVGCWLNWRWVRYLGVISYSLYLYQQIAIVPTRNLLGQFPYPLQVLGAVGVAVLLASLSYYVVERPALSFKKRFEVRH